MMKKKFFPAIGLVFLYVFHIQAQMPIPKRQMTIEASKAYFKGLDSIKYETSLFSVEGSDLFIPWRFAKEVKILGDTNYTVVILPIFNRQILVNILLDAYAIFFYDNMGKEQMHLKFYQADDELYDGTTDPRLETFTGFLWDFSVEDDIYNLFRIENGNVTSCGCSKVLLYDKVKQESTSFLDIDGVVGCVGWKSRLKEKSKKPVELIWSQLLEFILNMEKAGGSKDVKYLVKKKLN